MQRTAIVLVAALATAAGQTVATGAAMAAVAAMPACRSEQLQATLFLQGAGGHLVGALGVRNRGRSCALRGRPRLTLRSGDGHLIRSLAHAATPRWRHVSGTAPRRWPVVQLRPRQRAFVWLDVTNWCRSDGERVRFHFTLPATAGSITASASIRLRCESAHAPVGLGVGPFEPAL